MNEQIFNYTVKSDFKTKIYVCIASNIHEGNLILGVFLNRKEAERCANNNHYLVGVQTAVYVEEWYDGEMI